MTELRRQRLQSEVDANNSTAVVLGIGGVFTGVGTDLSENDYVTALIALYSDVDSAADGLEVQFSADNATWYTTDEYSYEGGTGPKIYHIPRILRYFRVKYTNGGVGQATFLVEVTLLTGTVRGSSHRLEDDLVGQDDAEVTKSIIAAKIPSGHYHNIEASARGALNVVITEQNQDAFGRVRVSDPVSLLDSTFGYNLNPRQFEDISSGNGVVTFDPVRKSAHLSVTAGAPGVAGLQSYQYCHYNPGKSHLIFMTFCPDPTGTDYTSDQKLEVGYFDDDNGLFVRGVGSVNPGVVPASIYVVRRSKVSGVVVEEAVERANWNIDVLDGTGSEDNPSGVAISADASQILVIDLQFLGVGRVRMGMEVAGAIVFCHEFNFANSQTGMYMQSATLPVRWRFEDTSAVGYDYAEGYCCMVTTEGGAEEDRGIPFTAGSAAGKAVPTGADTHLISIRPLLTFNALANRIWNILQDIHVLNTGNNEIIVKVWYEGGPLGGTPAWAAVDASDSGMEYDTAGTWVAGTGIKIAEFYVAATNQAKDAGAFAVKSRLPIALDKAAAVPVGMISVTAQAIGGASAAWASIGWREVR